MTRMIRYQQLGQFTVHKLSQQSNRKLNNLRNVKYFALFKSKKFKYDNTQYFLGAYLVKF